MSLSLSDLRILSTAQGYTELGMYLEAERELENIDPDLRDLAPVLGVRLQIHAGKQEWDVMQAVAKRLFESDPKKIQWIISWAYATRRLESVMAAKEILLDAKTRFPDEAIVHYNLACYDAWLGNSAAALEHLARCFKINAGYRQLALEDEDLISVRSFIVDEADPSF